MPPYQKRITPFRAKIAKPTTRRFDDGREVCLNNADGRQEYESRKQQAWAMQQARCRVCQLRMSLAECRLTGGNWEPTGQLRDDRLTDGLGRQVNFLVHKHCLRSWHEQNQSNNSQLHSSEVPPHEVLV